jgi:hypothetical protein
MWRHHRIMNKRGDKVREAEGTPADFLEEFIGLPSVATSQMRWLDRHQEMARWETSQALDGAAEAICKLSLEMLDHTDPTGECTLSADRLRNLEAEIAPAVNRYAALVGDYGFPPERVSENINAAVQREMARKSEDPQWEMKLYRMNPALYLRLQQVRRKP